MARTINNISEELKNEIISYYLAPNSIKDTCDKFLLNGRTLCKLLEINNIQKHTKDISDKIAKSKKTECPLCHLFIGNLSINRHLASHNKKENKKPSKGKGNHIGHKAWNKGLTKETDERVKKQSDSLKGKSNGWEGRHHSEETKKKISEIRKKYLEEHPDKVPFVLNHSSKQSYPEKYFEEWLITNNLFCESEFQVGRYSLDFAWPDKLFYIEVDGSQHKLDWMVKHDLERTAYLESLGWTCLERIFWPDYQKMSDEDRKEFLDELVNKIIS